MERSQNGDIRKRLSRNLIMAIRSRGYIGYWRGEAKQDRPWQREGDFNDVASDLWLEGWHQAKGEAISHERGA
jgi:hypothetical protein